MRFLATIVLFVSATLCSTSYADCPNCGGVGTSTTSVRIQTTRVPGPTWSYRGTDLSAHLRSTHGIDTSGMSYEQMVIAHSNAHNSSISIRSRNVVRNGIIRSRSVSRVRIF